MKSNLILLGLLLASFFLQTATVLGQERFLKRALDAIQEGKYDYAVEQIGRYVAKEGNKPETDFINHLLTKKTGHDIANLEESVRLLEMAIGGYNTLSEKQRSNWCKELDFCEKNFKVLRDEVDDLLFEAVKATNRMQDVVAYQKKYPGSNNFRNAEKWRIHLEFEDAKKSNTEEAYSRFLVTYNQHEDATAARDSMWQRAWEKADRKNTLDAFNNFVEKYPEATQVNKAFDRIYQIAWADAEKIKTEDGYRSFSLTYPRATQASLAMEKAEAMGWSRAQAENQWNEYLRFYERYPTSSFRKEAYQRAEQLAWQTAVLSESSGPMEEYIVRFPNSLNLDSARLLIEERKLDVLPWLTSKRTYRLYNIRSNNFISSDQYDNIAVLGPNRFLVCRNGSQGVIDKTGKFIIPAQFTSVSPISSARYIVTRDGMSGVYNSQGKVVIPIEYSGVSEVATGWLIIRKEEGTRTLSGLVDDLGEVRVPCRYENLSFLRDSLFAFSKGNFQGIISSAGREIIAPRFESIFSKSNYFFFVQEKGKWGLIRANGTYITKPVYDYVFPTSEQGGGCYALLPRNQYVLFDTSGMILYKGSEMVQHLGDRFYSIGTNEFYSESVSRSLVRIFDAGRRQFLTPESFSGVSDLAEGKFRVTRNGRDAFIDTAGKLVIPFNLERYTVTIFDNDGEVGEDVSEFYYEEVDEKQEAECQYISDQFISLSNISIGDDNSLVHSYSGGLAAANIGDKVGFIDAAGRFRIPAKYSSVKPFSYGITEVSTTKEGSDYEVTTSLIDSAGSVIAEDASLINVNPKAGTAIIRKTKSDGYDYLYLDIKRRVTTLIAAGMNWLTAGTDFYFGEYKDVKVYMPKDGKLLMDNLDFKNYDALKLADEAEGQYYSQEYDHAIRLAEQAQALRPRFLRAMMLMASCYKKKEDISKAFGWYNKAVETAPALLTLRRERAHFLYDNQYWHEAREDYSVIVESEMAVYDDWFRKGYTESQLQKWTDGITSYTQALKLNPNDVTSYNNRGVCYAKNGQALLAISDYSAGIRNSSGSTDELKGFLYNNRGEVLYSLNRKAEACADFRKAAAFGNTNAKNNLRFCTTPKPVRRSAPAPRRRVLLGSD